MSRPGPVSGSRGPAWRVGSFTLLAVVSLFTATPVLADPTGRAPMPAAAVAKQGETYSVEHYTIDGGGGWSTGGAFTIEGTIGQPDADPLQPSTGGVYAVTGGFWPAGAMSGPLPDPLFADGFES